MNAHGFVTAGGLSSRMGSDKAWLELDGRPMIQRVIDVLLAVAPTVSVIANDPKYGRLGLPLLSDQNPGIGPLEAIRVALAASVAPRVVLVACDLPFVTAELLRLLLDRARDFEAVVPLSAEGRLEPLCAVYSAEALMPVTQLISAGERKVSRLFDRVRTNLVGFDEFRQLTDSEKFFFNVNTPADYAEARQSR